jgi:hypothetical protein
MNLVDDATASTLGRLGGQETIWAAAGVLRRWIEKYGVPVALYTDWKNVYVREATEKELLRGEVPVTQFGRMCERLEISSRAQSAVRADGRFRAGLSPPEAEPEGTRPRSWRPRGREVC